MSAPMTAPTFAKKSLEMRLANTFIGFGVGLIVLVLAGFVSYSLGAPEGLFITMFVMAALSGVLATYALLAMVLTLKLKENG